MKVVTPGARAFAVALGRSVILVGNEQQHDSSSSSSSSAVYVVCTEWDCNLDKFLPPRKWMIPSSEEMEVLAAQIVSGFDTGMLQPYIVLSGRSIIKIGAVDLVDDGFELLAEFSLPRDFVLQPLTHEIECLLTNGPSVIVSSHGKILIIYPHNFSYLRLKDLIHEDSKASLDKEMRSNWVSLIISFRECNKRAKAKIIMTCEENKESVPIIYVAVNDGNFDILSSKKAEWQYIKLDLHKFINQIPDREENTNHTLVHTWEKIYQEYDISFYRENFPFDLNPFAISCIELVPTVSSFSIDIPFEIDSDLNRSSRDIVIATYDKRILKCSNGKIVAQISLPDVAVSLAFSVLDRGQGILIALFSETAMAICLETFDQIEVWSNVATVAVADYQLLGHDQVLLLKAFPTIYPNPTFSLQLLLKSMYMTDFKITGFVGINDHQQLSYSGGSIAVESKIQHFQTFAKFLEVRIESGKMKNEQLKAKMEEKKHLVKASCNLLKDMFSQAVLASMEECAFLRNEMPRCVTNAELHLCKVQQLYHGLQGGRWLILITICSQLPSGVVLDGATLLLSTNQGQIAESTSTVTRIEGSQKIYKFVIETPLENFSAFSCMPSVNIMLKAWITHKEEVHKDSHVQEEQCHLNNQQSNLDKTHRYLHNEWLGRLIIRPDNLLHQISPHVLPFMKSVGEREHFIFKPTTSASKLSVLPDELKNLLHIDICQKEIDSLQLLPSSKCMLTTENNNPLGFATIHLFKDMAFLTLNIKNLELLMRMEALLISQFQHRYRICCSRTVEEMLGAIMSFCRMEKRKSSFDDLMFKPTSSNDECNGILSDIKNLSLPVDECILSLFPF